MESHNHEIKTNQNYEIKKSQSYEIEESNYEIQYVHLLCSYQCRLAQNWLKSIPCHPNMQHFYIHLLSFTVLVCVLSLTKFPFSFIFCYI